MRKSTSPVAINGDLPLGRFAKITYLGANALRNSLDRRIGGLRLESFRSAQGVAISGTPSPSRLLCERHLAGFEWLAFGNSADGIRMHEMGCGSGRAGRLVAAAAGMPIAYSGFDVRENPAWAAPMERAKMSVFDGRNFAGTIGPGDNFFFSQSAAEHIAFDLDYFAAVARACEKSVGPTLQIHYLPSAACLRLYLFHGLRQYPVGSLARIAALQGPRAICSAVALGGPAMIALHWRWITWPLIRRRIERRDEDPEGYRASLAEALAESGQVSAPLFWAFVVRTGL